ncbi:serine hydrolase [uncultured Sunxiuqinia sp.]|uniref:serine hydrolase domain-containing protein n=1 Tax=uncultured Sunxiuqinia sp. TaxID=1573825 RepID=UPI002AA6D94A|nr:serine hydrolase [uncultured Sunxiuqinia sp.]
MKKRLFVAILIAVIIGAVYYLNLLMPVVTGYAAKNLASGVFVAGRSQEAMENEDLNFSVVAFTDNTVDFEKREVVSRFLWSESKAVYIEGYGCILVKEYSEDEIKGRSYPLIESLPVNPDTVQWPKGNLIADTIAVDVDTVKLKQALTLAMQNTIPFKGTFALMVVYKGQPIAEVYREDFNKDNRFLSWSMAKSFTNALVGLRVKDGKMDIHQPLEIEEWQDDKRKGITLNNLMHMNSGLKWNEGYGNLSDVTIMLHKKGDMGLYAQQKAYEYPADSVWLYSSGTTNLVCRELRKTFASDEEYFAFPRKALFNKIGMTSAVFEVDASGTFVGSSYLYATMRDYARFALLYLNGGNWQGEQLLPKGWVDYTSQVANGSNGRYGSFLWLNESAEYPDAPKDMLMCKGHDGQFICIVPSKELIVIRTGYSKKGEFDLNRVLDGVLKSIGE